MVRKAIWQLLCLQMIMLIVDSEYARYILCLYDGIMLLTAV